MLTLHPDLKKFESVVSDWFGSIFNRVENQNKMGAGQLFLFIENLDVNLTKFKKEFVLRGKRKELITYKTHLKGCQ